ncbi:unnamed protein product [Symbiodinium microadriaticum]|nr:unnamed protein product [Symbiodinium microadriaticum]
MLWWRGADHADLEESSASEAAEGSGNESSNGSPRPPRTRPVLSRAYTAPASTTEHTSKWTKEEILAHEHPEKKQRRCTDVSWLLVFLLLLSVLLVFGFKSPSFTALLKLADYGGNVCGTAGKAHQRFAYICAVHAGELQTAFTVCRESCPSSNHSKYRCSNNLTGVDAEAVDYPTDTSIFHISNLCVPRSVELANRLFVHHARAAEEARLYVALRRLWVPLLMAALVGIGISYRLLFVLKKHAESLLKTGVAVIILIPWTWALFLYVMNGKDAEGFCWALVLIGVFLGCISSAHATTLELAAGCIESSCECVLDMPLLQLGPLVVLLTRACAISFMLFCLLVSPAGIFYNHQARVVSFDCGQEHCTGSLIFFICWTGMLLWVEAVITAAWEFAVSYLACTWYFDDPKLERKSGTTLWKLSYTLLRYHLGSMVKAAVVIGFLRPFRFIFGTITQVARMEYNPLRGLIFFFLGCFVHLYEQHFDRFSADAYVELALTAEPVSNAAVLACKVGETQVTFSSTKTGTTFVMQLVWGAIVWWAGYFTVYVIVGGHCPGLEGYGNPYSSYFVGNPHLWSNAGGVISLVAAFPYMMVFDAVSDTLLYCDIIDLEIAKFEEKARQEARLSKEGFFLERLRGLQEWLGDRISMSSSDDASSSCSSSSLP